MLINRIEHFVDEMGWLIQEVAANFDWEKARYGKEYVGVCIDDSIKYEKEIGKLLGILRAAVPTKEALSVELKPKQESKGKGKLNLHELDRELKARQMDFREETYE